MAKNSFEEEEGHAKKRRRPRYEDDDRPRRRSRKDSSASGSFPWLVLLGVGGFLLIGLIVALVVILGSSSSQSGVLDEFASILVEISQTYEGLKDPTSAQAAVPRMESLAGRLDSLREKLPSLPTLSSSQTMEFFRKTQGIETRFQKSLNNLTPQVFSNPAFEKAHSRLTQAQEKFMTAMESKFKFDQ